MSFASGWTECLIPASADTAQERRIDDQFAEGVDQGHIERRKATYTADIDSEIETVTVRGLDQGAQRRSVGCPIDQLNELLVFEAVDDREEAWMQCEGKYSPRG